MNDLTLRIGNCSGFLGDRSTAATELLASGDLDVLTGDWLAELTMTILRKQHQRDPDLGFATTFLGLLETVLGTCLDRGIKIVSNAGGLNPGGCARAVTALATRLGLTANVAHLTGDDLVPRLDELVAGGHLLDLATRAPLDVSGGSVAVANAYLGGWGIAAALREGADVVVTGRVTDASVVVGPAAWAFDWQPDDWDQLAGAVVAGHVIECGTQATGGNFSFFEEVPGFESLGFPIAEIRRDGTSVITKRSHAGGVVSRETVTAQLLYEIQTTHYLNPDVTVDLTSVQLAEEDFDRIRIHGVIGSAPSDHLKVSLAEDGGYRNAMTLVLTGLDVEAKAAVAERALWAAIPGGRSAFDDVVVELAGRPFDDPDSQGAATAMLRIAVAGRDARLVGRGFSSAVIETGLASYPGFFTTTPPTAASTFFRYRPALVPANLVAAQLHVGGRTVPVPATAVALAPAAGPAGPDPTMTPRAGEADGPTRRISIGRLLGARSGDKGGDVNLGVWARDDDTHDWMNSWLSADRLRELLPETAGLEIERYELPYLRAVNFVVRGLLGDGVSSCLRLDAQGKGVGEWFRSRSADVPARLVEPR